MPGPKAGEPDLAPAEPKALRYRLLHTAARIIRGGRRIFLNPARAPPWTTAIINAFTRLRLVPAPTIFNPTRQSTLEEPGQCAGPTATAPTIASSRGATGMVVEAINTAIEAVPTRAACFMVTRDDGTWTCRQFGRADPGGHEKKSVLLSSGAEAVENAIKISRVHTGGRWVVVFDNVYHGRTNLTMAMTAKHRPSAQGFGPFAGEIYRAPMSYPFR